MSVLKRWDIFCKIVDNFGDIGVCWRLARQLRREHGLQIRLWIDDLQAAQQIIPSLNVAENAQLCDEITIIKLHENANFSQAADVVIEAFACELPATYLAAMARNKLANMESKWVNIEYLSAENWVADFHAKPSPQNFINSNHGLTRYFYFPGFTEATGGLIREDETSGLTGEADIAVQLQTVINPHPHAGEGARQRVRGAAQVNLHVDPFSNLSDGTTKQLTRLTNDISQVIANPAGGREVDGLKSLSASLFCYPHAPIYALLDSFSRSTHVINCYVPASSILPQIAAYFGVATIEVGDCFTRENLHVHILPFLSQADYDQLLRDCDLNFVRGEDSWVRAIWACKPFIWQPYFQDENTYIKKLSAFLDLFYADFDAKQVVCEAHSAWVSGQFSTETWRTYLENISEIKAYTRLQSNKLAKQTDLASKLVTFCNQL